MQRRPLAAIEAAPSAIYNSKRLAVLLDSDFATKLENAVKRSEACKAD